MISYNALLPSPTGTIPVARIQVGPHSAGCIPASEASDPRQGCVCPFRLLLRADTGLSSALVTLRNQESCRLSILGTWPLILILFSGILLDLQTII